MILLLCIIAFLLFCGLNSKPCVQGGYQPKPCNHKNSRPPAGTIMGWADCGVDSEGRPIGYAHEAVCDHPGCKEKINRGLSYACGDMHDEDVCFCEKYFCEKHRSTRVQFDGGLISVCDECRDDIAAAGWEYDEEEDIYEQKLDSIT